MSFVPNVQNQISFQSTEYLLTDREKSMLQNSWATYFSDFVFLNCTLENGHLYFWGRLEIGPAF